MKLYIKLIMKKDLLNRTEDSTEQSVIYCYFILGVELISDVLFVLDVHEFDSVIHRCISVLFLFFSSYKLLQFVQ